MESVSSPSTMRLFTTTMSGIKRSCPDNSDNTSDSDSECGGAILRQDLMGDLGAQNGTGLIDGPKPGKKTKGRVKIKMEFIENKLRRYTTFSKRKTGIMKKAYELSTLTGTQVMLLVASETGHVYTFATRKLQPMITSESGKALIQTCLNSPDSPLDVAKATSDDQRMNPTGYEETDLSYAVSDDEVVQQPPQQQLQQQPPMSSSPSKVEVTKSAALSSLSSSSPSRRCHHHHQSAVSSTSTDCTSASSSPPYQHQFGQDMVASNLAHRSKPSSSCATEMLRLKQEPSSVCQTSLSSRDNNNHSHSKQKAAAAAAAAAASVSRSMQTSTSAAAATALSLSSSPISHPPATGASQDSLHPGQLLINQCKPQPHQQQQQQLQQQMFYRIPGTNQIISLSLTGAGGQGSLLYQTYTTSSPSPSTLSSPTAATTGTSPSSSSSSSSSPFSQSTSNPLSGTDGFLLNLPQAASAAAAALGTKTLDAGNGATQQFITIPVPISLSSSSQMLPFFNHQASIKTELLPTDLRFNGLEKTAK